MGAGEAGRRPVLPGYKRPEQSGDLLPVQKKELVSKFYEKLLFERREWPWAFRIPSWAPGAGGCLALAVAVASMRIL